jgi:hypothetical protein
MDLRERLRSPVENEVKLYHAVFLSGRGGTRRFSHIIKRLEPSFEVNRRKPLRHIPVDAGDGVWAHHCFFGQTDKGIQILCEALKGLSHQLNLAFESDALPAFDRVKVKGYSEANVIRWVGVLYYLAWKHEDPSLWAELDYSDSDVDLHLPFEIWDECEASETCDPRPFITSTGLQNRKLILWSPIHRPPHRVYPELVTAYLTTDVLQASMAAIALLKYYGVKPQPSDAVKPRRKHEKKSAKKHEQTAPAEEGILKGTAADREIRWVLVDHYRCFRDEVITEYINTVQIAAKCSENRLRKNRHAKQMSPGTVSKRMPYIFPKGGLQRYDELCGGDEKMTASKVRIKKYLEEVCENELGRLEAEQVSQIDSEDSSESILDSGHARRISEGTPGHFMRVKGKMQGIVRRVSEPEDSE